MRLAPRPRNVDSRPRARRQTELLMVRLEDQEQVSGDRYLGKLLQELRKSRGGPEAQTFREQTRDTR